MSIICIDIGTTRCKIAVINSHGSLLTECAFQPEAQMPNNEIDCEAIFHSIDKQLVKLFSQFHDIEAITTTSFGETLICANQDGSALSPGILYFDTRAKPQIERLCNVLGEQTIYKRTGHRLGTVSPLAKLCWLQEHQTELIEKTTCFLFVADYILVRLGALPFMSRSFAITSNWIDCNTETEWSEALKAIGISPRKFPRYVMPVIS